jgi:hypothetical protein
MCIVSKHGVQDVQDEMVLYVIRQLRLSEHEYPACISMLMYMASRSLCCCAAAGGPEGVKGVASQLITQHQLDDTFYVVDLANVVRLFKVWARVGARLV